MDVQYNNYQIVTEPGFLLKVIKPIGRGSVPKQLRGSFTSLHTAKRTIDMYGEEKEVEQEVEDGKTNRRSRTK